MIQQFDQKDKVLVLDFDHTCYDTDAFLLFEIRQAMISRFNIPVLVREESYENAVKIGYSLEQHLEELTRILKYKICSIEEIKFFETSINFSKYLYPDVISVLEEAIDTGYKIMLLSFGDESWQNKKVQGSGLDKFIDIIKYTKEEGGKVEILKKYTEHCASVIFVENNGIDIDQVHKELPYVKTYFMNRVPEGAVSGEMSIFLDVRYKESRKIAERNILYNHTLCQSLYDVVL